MIIGPSICGVPGGVISVASALALGRPFLLHALPPRTGLSRHNSELFPTITNNGKILSRKRMLSVRRNVFTENTSEEISV